jgi:hypothetical protein
MLLSPAVQLLLDQFEHPREIVDHVAVPEADDPVAAAREVLRPGGIFLLLLGMLSAVKLDRELARGAGKIDDIRPDRMPAAETVLVQHLAHAPPKPFLGIGRSAPQPLALSVRGLSGMVRDPLAFARRERRDWFC